MLEKYGVELIGASVEAIKVAEDRLLFRDAMREIGAAVPDSRYVRSMEEALAAIEEIGFPVIIRPSFTLGGVGGGIAYNIEEFRELAGRGIDLSPVHEVLLEESVIGWKEFELEVMRDRADNFVVICSIENVDPMGVHTGDSITVAPALTLTDKEYQRMRDIARRIIRRVGVETGGSNIQFAINPQNGRIIVIEMNPRVSRSSALGVEGDRLPDREDRGQAGARLPPRRDPERHHAADARLLRADDRLRRGQGAALGVREVPARRPDADDADEVGRRGDGDRPHLQGSLHEGVPLAGAGRQRTAVRPDGGRRPTAGSTAEEETGALQRELSVPTDRRMWAVFRALERGWTVERAAPAHAHRSVVPDAVLADRRADAIGGARRPARHLARHAAHAEARRLRRLRAGDDARRRRGRRPRQPARARAEARLQAHRHLRRGIRVVHAVSLRHLRDRSARRTRRRARRSSSSAAARTASARASSSTTAAATPPSPCARRGSRPS